jgi:hypothetical protein
LRAVGERDQRAPRRHAGDERLRPVDRIEVPDVVGVRPVGAEFLADHPVVRELAANQRSHRLLGSAVGRRHRIEGGAAALVLDAERGAEIGQNHLARCRRQSVDKGPEIDRCHDCWLLSVARGTSI